MTKLWFITGTDTSVGKTVASCALLQAFAHQSYRVSGYKPVASGSYLTSEGLQNEDALALGAHSSIELCYNEINPVALKTPTSPHIAADIENQLIDIKRLSVGLNHLKPKSDIIIIEGAGGWYTPINNEQYLSDWVVKEDLNVILVVGIKLGCINHALLTQRALTDENVTLAGWIANSVEPRNSHYNTYLNSLKERIHAPLVGEIPYLAQSQKQDKLGQYISVELLN